MPTLLCCCNRACVNPNLRVNISTPGEKSRLNNTQGFHRAGSHTHAATCAGLCIDLRPTLVACGDGFVITACTAGHADDVFPGNTAVTVQHQLTDAGCGLVPGFDIQRACFDTGTAKGAAVGFKVQIRYAGQAMVARVDLDDPGFAGGYTRTCTTGAMRFQRHALMPGRRRSQWVLPSGFFAAALTGQIGAT